jgi:hypothetical protein
METELGNMGEARGAGKVREQLSLVDLSFWGDVVLGLGWQYKLYNIMGRVRKMGLVARKDWFVGSSSFGIEKGRRSLPPRIRY